MNLGNSKKNPRLFYLFSSDGSPRYKKNVLDILCYPEGHIFRFRYQEKYVSEEIKLWGKSPENIEEKLNELGPIGRKGITIYAETSSPSPYKHFTFYPTRQVEIIHIKVEGTVYYVDVRLGKFIKYYLEYPLPGSSTVANIEENFHYDLNRKVLEETIKQSRFYPLPPLMENENKEKYGKTWDCYDQTKTLPDDYNSTLKKTTQGYFFSFAEELPEIAKLFEKDNEISNLSKNLAWESTVDVISRATTMKSAIFYRVLGFYEYKRLWYWLWFLKGEVNTELKTSNLNTIYFLPMGKTVTLKLLFYKSEESWNEIKQVRNQTLEIKTKSDVFAGFSQENVHILSRYNEELIQIACKRVFDSVFAPISIELKKVEKDGDSDESRSEIIAPQPYLVTKVSISPLLILGVIFFTVSASILLTFSPDIFKALGETNYLKSNAGELSDYLIKNGGFLTGVSKSLGAISTLIAAFLAFRKLPVGGK